MIYIYTHLGICIYINIYIYIIFIYKVCSLSDFTILLLKSIGYYDSLFNYSDIISNMYMQRMK